MDGFLEKFVLSSKEWQLPTGEVPPTFSIGLSFIFLAYVLHPLVESAYQRVRAYRAWRAIEKGDEVEVTTYPLLAEVFGGRGKWDAARTVAVLLAAFSLVSWVLELSLGVFPIDATADLLTQPPPVYRNGIESTSTWQVWTLEQIKPGYNGAWLELENVFDTLAKSRYYVRNFRQYAWSAKTDMYIDGEIVVASWDRYPMPTLSYGAAAGISDADFQQGDAAVQVKAVDCTGPNDPLVNASVELASDTWGRVFECGEGPAVDGQAQSQPAIILTHEDTGDKYVIVEETSRHPSFLYSVWTAGGGATAATDQLKYSFHIASSVRLAAAVVTGIVNGQVGGGECFGLLRAFSRGDNANADTEGGSSSELKASPFGENPPEDRDTVLSLQEVEAIEAGMLLNTNAVVSFVCLGLLSFVGIVWSICLNSSVGMDIYDRDELLRTISHQALGLPDDPASHSSMRIYVQKEDSGKLNVEITDAGGEEDGGGGGGGVCARLRRFRRLRRTPTASVYPGRPANDFSSNYSGAFGGAPIPAGRRRTCLIEGIRTAMGRPFPGPRNNYMYPVTSATPSPAVSLTASPVPSYAPSPARSTSAVVTPTRSNFFGLSPTRSTPANGTPAGPRLLSQEVSRTNSAEVGGGGGRGGGGRTNNFGFLGAGAAGGRGPSVMFDSVFSDGSSGGGQDTDGHGDIEAGGAGLPRPGGPLAKQGRSQGELVPASIRSRDATRAPGDGNVDVDAGDKRDGAEAGLRGGDDDPMHIPSDRTTPPVSPGPSPPPQRGRLVTVHTLGPPEMGPLARESREDGGEAKTQETDAADGGGGETDGEGRGHVEMGRTRGGGGGDTPQTPFHRTASPESPGSSPLPSQGLPTVQTLGPPQMGPLTRESGEDGGEGEGEVQHERDLRGASPLPTRGLTTLLTLGPPQMGPLSRESREEWKEEWKEGGGGEEGRVQESDSSPV